MNDSLKISVVVPLYQGEKYIEKCLLSLLGQDHAVNEIVIVNDGSTDNGRSIVEKIRLESQIKIKIIDQENSGLASARNTGIKNSTGDWIAFLDCDDLWEKNKISEQIHIIQNNSNSNLGLVYCDYFEFDEQGKKNKSPIPPEIKAQKSEKLFNGNFISGSGSAVIIKAEVFEKVGMFDPELRSCEDWDLWLRINQQYSFDFVNKPLVGILLRSNSLSKNKNQMHWSKTQLLKKNFPLNQEAFAKLIKKHLIQSPSLFLVFAEISFLKTLELPFLRSFFQRLNIYGLWATEIFRKVCSRLF